MYEVIHFNFISLKMKEKSWLLTRNLTADIKSGKFL